jgi:hypothetical protein
MANKWRVICVQGLSRYRVFVTNDRGKAEAKATRLNKLSKGTAKYIVEEETNGEMAQKTDCSRS